MSATIGSDSASRRFPGPYATRVAKPYNRDHIARLPKEEIAERGDVCSSVGLDSFVECAWFDESRRPSPEHARMQFVVRRAV